MCVLYSTLLLATLLVEASKIWKVRRKSIGSLQEFRRNFFLNNYPTHSKYTCYVQAGGTFFQLCCCVSFLVVAEIVLVDTYLPYQLCCCVFFLLRREIVFGCTGQFFGCGGK